VTFIREIFLGEEVAATFEAVVDFCLYVFGDAVLEWNRLEKKHKG
jgi:hypothetical protein